MLDIARTFYPGGRLYLSLPILAGITIAGLVTVMLTLLKIKWLILSMSGLLFFLPAIIIKDSKPYWLTLFIISLPFEISKNIFKDFIDSQWIFNNLGMPPLGALNFKLFLSDFPLFILLVLLALRLFTKKQTLYFPRIAILISIWLGWITLMAIFAEYPQLSFLQLVREYKYFIMFLVLINTIHSKPLIKTIVISLLFTLFLEGFITAIRYMLASGGSVFGSFFGFGTEEQVDIGILEGGDSGGKTRSVGTFSHPSGAAMYIAMLLPLSVLFFFISKEKLKLLYFSLAALGMIGLIVTFSRTGLVALLAGMAVSFLIAIRRGLLSKRLKLLTTLLCLGLVLGSPLAYNYVYKYMTTRPEAFKYRFFLIETAWNMLKSNPIIGVGLANSTAVKRDYLTVRRYKGDESTAIHNNHLTIIVETGIVGYVLFMGIFTILSLDGLRLSTSKDSYIGPTSAAILSAYIGLFVFALGDNLAGNAHNTLIWIFAALLVVFQKMDPNRVPPT